MCEKLMPSEGIDDIKHVTYKPWTVILVTHFDK